MFLYANMHLTLERWGHTFNISTDPMGGNWAAWVDGEHVGSGTSFDDLMASLVERFGL